MSSSSSQRVLTALVTYVLVISSLVPPAQATLVSVARLAGSKQEQSHAPHREGELLVRFHPGVSQRDREVMIATHGARRKKNLTSESGVEQLVLPAGQDVRSAGLQMMLSGLLEFAEPNFLIAKDDVTPNDARFTEQWALRNLGQNGGQFGSDINVSAAWSSTTGSPSTTIAVIDSGIDFSHPDLINNRWLNPAPGVDGDVHGWDFVANSAEIRDEQGHGTAVAGIIAAKGNNSVGITGVMWRARLMSLRVLDNTGTGDVANAIAAIDYAVSHGAHVINLSWGTSGESVALRDAIERAIRSNVVVVCSAGNGSRDLTDGPYYPASFASHGLISVAASDNFDRLTSWSNWEAKSVTVAAPGTDILTTQMGGGYWNVSGTSVAAPLVSGIAGLLRTIVPGGVYRECCACNTDTSGSIADASNSRGIWMMKRWTVTSLMTMWAVCSFRAPAMRHGWRLANRCRCSITGLTRMVINTTSGAT